MWWWSAIAHAASGINWWIMKVTTDEIKAQVFGSTMMWLTDNDHIQQGVGNIAICIDSANANTNQEKNDIKRARSKVRHSECSVICFHTKVKGRSYITVNSVNNEQPKRNPKLKI